GDVRALLNFIERVHRAQGNQRRNDAREQIDPHDVIPLGSLFPLQKRIAAATDQAVQMSRCCDAICSASTTSSGVLTLRNGSTGLTAQSAMATPWRAVQTSILSRSSSVSALR